MEIDVRFARFAAGLGIGYLLGSRAGREKYEQILATARKVSGNSAASQAPDAADTAADREADTSLSNVAAETGVSPSPASATSARPRKRRTPSSPTTPPGRRGGTAPGNAPIG
jgi:hypothetical protein